MLRDAVPLGECGRALVVKLRHHGDVLLAAPVLTTLKSHAPKLKLDALRRVGVQPSLDDRKVVFVPGKQAEARVSRLAPEGFIHMHPASRWTFKCWPAEKNAELIDRFASEGHQVVLTSAGDPAELDMVQKIVALAKAKTISLAGTLSIKELGALTARARLFVGVDSMPMHLAAAMGTPTVALFGPSGENEWGPWNVERRIVTTVHTCRPCGLDGCGGGKVSECLRFLPVDAVHAAARELLA